MPIDRRSFLRGVAAVGGTAGIAALLTACAPGTAPAIGPAASPQTFRVAYLTLGWAGIEIVHQLRLLEEKGWSIEWQAVDAIGAIVNAFGAGQVDVIDMSAIIAAQMYEQGVRIAVFGAGVGSLGSVIAGKGSSIRSLPELRGRTIAGIPGSTTSQDLNALTRKVHGFDLFTDTRFVQGSTPPDVANLLTQGEVEVALTWEPTTTLLTRSGAGSIVATQQQLWEQATGTMDIEVHVVYVTTPGIAAQHPALLRDLNAAQAQVAELWKQGDSRAVDGMTTVTRLPREVVQEALGRTTPLSGLPDRSVDAMLQQIQFNRQYGTILKSDVWTDDPARARREMFVQVS